MGKIKLKEKKIDRRGVEISAPILDPEIIEAIHSPHKLDLRHGGFKVLLDADNPIERQLVDGEPMTPAYEIDHLPSYIGISCAVSGYSNYYNPRHAQLATRPLDDSTNTTRSETNISRASASRLASTPTPNQARLLSRTSSPRPTTPIVSHFRLDKSKFGTIEQERRELTGLMAASLSEKQLNHRQLLVDGGGGGGGVDQQLIAPPTGSDRHHGAYVGARYSPMPDPADPAPKHIPLLGIDDELEPDEAARELELEAENKVVRRVASLYGEDFAENWQEDVNTKSVQPANESVRL